MGHFFRDFRKIPSPRTSEWFIFNGIMDQVRVVYVCLENLTADCFVNVTEFAKKLLLTDEAVS